jgi:eukaryotic-like serine/threonine-protein kinase
VDTSDTSDGEAFASGPMTTAGDRDDSFRTLSPGATGSAPAARTVESDAHDRPTMPAVTAGGATTDQADQAASVWQADPPTAAGSCSPRERPRPVIDGYEILGELGRGGMGIVYRARHVRLNRPCVLKMILAGDHAGPQAIARFLAEAKAVARLRHPNVVLIHHVGEAAGLPFFELEYVEGGSLDLQLDGTPWPPGRAAALVEALAQGVAEAHRMGIIHRDLKPGNVLLAADGTPKITDFGLAKSLTEDSGLTQTGVILGTPGYMAPEQAEGKTRAVGPLADVYALGAILYVLITGRPPFRGATVLETLEQSRTTEPVPPSRLVPGLARDMETIALKCLQREAGKRYSSAAALAEDLQRFVDGRPILARRISSSERVYRWCKRNPVVTGLLGTVVALLLVGFVGAITAAIYFGQTAASERLARVDADNARKAANDRRRDAEASRGEALSQKQQAEANFALARKAVDDSFARVSESALLKVPGLRPLRRELMESARPFYEEFLRDREGDPSLLTDLAATQFRIGQILSDLGEQDKARLALGRAVELYDKALAAQPGGVDLMERQAEVWHRLADLDYGRDNRSAYAAYRKAIAIRERLAATHPAEPRFRMALSRSLNGLAISGAPADEKRDAYRRSLELRLKLADEIPEDPDLLHGLGESFVNVGILLWNDGHREESVALVKRSIEYGRAAVARRPHDLEFASDLTGAYNNCAAFFWQLGRRDEAVALSGDGLAFLRKLSADNPDVPVYRDALANAVGTHGAYLMELGRTDDAVLSCRQAAEMMETRPEPAVGALATAALFRARVAWLLAGESAPRGLPSWPEPARREVDQAVADVRASVARGLRRADVFRANEFFKPLITRDDVKALLAEMERPAVNPRPAPAGSTLAAPAPSPLDRPDRLDEDRFLGEVTISLLLDDKGKPDEVRARLEGTLARIEARRKAVPGSPALEAAARSLRVRIGAMLDPAFPSDPFAR